MSDSKKTGRTPPLSSDTTWGQAEADFDKSALLRYASFLNSGVKTGETLIIVLVIVMSLTTLVGLLTTNFELAIPSDGTPNTCQINSRTGEITNVE